MGLIVACVTKLYCHNFSFTFFLFFSLKLWSTHSKIDAWERQMRHFIILVVATISEDYAFALILFTPSDFLCLLTHHLHASRQVFFACWSREILLLAKKEEENFFACHFRKKKSREMQIRSSTIEDGIKRDLNHKNLW